MTGICKNKKCGKHGEEVMVHRGSWIVGVPKCHGCGENLSRTKASDKAVRSRMIEGLSAPEGKRT